MAGLFARLRRGGGDEPGPDAPTEVLEPVAGEAASPAATADGDAAASPAPPADAADPAAPPADEPPGFVERGKLRRRLRYVRRARELALRDLGGLVFDLHRFDRDRGDLDEQKLAALSTLDGEMRALEALLDDRREVTVLHEPGLASCPRCGALHGSDAAFCSACGLPVDRRAARPYGPTLTGPLPAPATTVQPGPAPQPAADQPAPDQALPDQPPAAREDEAPGANGTASGRPQPTADQPAASP